jgi:cytochrome c-type biogenesis protein CcmE
LATNRSPARLVFALSVAGALAVFLLYTVFAGSGVVVVKPSQLSLHKGTVQLVGAVVGPIRRAADTQDISFDMRDIGGKTTIPVVYSGTTGDLFKAGQDILVTGRPRSGVFVASRDSMITKCPSKYIPKKSA